MSYSHAGLYRLVQEAIDGQPGVSLRRLAGRVGVHRRTVLVEIREATGQSYREWPAVRRAALASRLLEERPELSVKEVAAPRPSGSAIRAGCGASC